MDIKFERRKKTKSLSIILAIAVLVLLIILIPEMLISRSNIIIKYKLDTTTTDSSFIKLTQVANSYLETADMFVIFSLQTDKMRSQLEKKILNRYQKSCEQDSSTQFCDLWKKILTKQQLKSCDRCANQ